MSTDAVNYYMDEQVIGTGAETSFTSAQIDHGVGGTSLSKQMFLEIVPSVNVVGPTVAFLITVESTDVVDSGNPELGDFSSPTDELIITLSDLTPSAGVYIHQAQMPPITKRWSRLTGAWTSGCSAGAMNAYMTDSPQASFTGS